MPVPSPASLLQALTAVVDPELQQNVVDLGLIYDVQAPAPGHAIVTMTLTTPHCPLADQIVQDVRSVLLAQPGVATVDVQLVWRPPWTPYRMAEPLRAALGLPADEPPPPGQALTLSWRERLIRAVRRPRPR